MKRLLAVAAVVVAAAAGGRAWLAAETARRYDRALERMPAADNLRVEKVSYEPTAWGADAVLRVTVERPARGEESGEPRKAAFDVSQRLTYGPFTSRGLGLAIVITRLDVPEALSAGAEPPLAAPALEASTLVEFGGALASEFRSEPYSGKLRPRGAGQIVAVEWKGASGVQRVSEDGAAVTVEASAPGLAVAAGDGRFALGPASVRGAMSRAGDALWLGDGELALERLEVRAGDDGTSVVAEALGVRGAQRRGPDGTLEGENVFTVARVEAAGREYRKGEIRFAVRRFDAEAVGRLQQLASRAPDDDALAEEAMRIGMAMLRRSPEIAVDPARVDGPSGPLSGRLVIGFHGEGFDSANPFEILGRVHAALDADVPGSVLEAGVEAEVRRELAAARVPADDREVARLVEERIRGFVAQGLLVRDRERARTALVFADGQLTVNGRPGDELVRQALELVFRALMAPPADPEAADPEAPVSEKL